MKKDCVTNFLQEKGIFAGKIFRNPTQTFLRKHELDSKNINFEKGQITELGAVNVMTGEFTGRSPRDKFIVKDNVTKDTIWWNTPEFPNDNHPVSQKTWDECKKIAVKQFSRKNLYVIDAYCGANKNSRLAVRFIMEVAWQAHFVTNMFIKPTKKELRHFQPDFTVYCASKAKVNNFKDLGLNSETGILFNLTSNEQIILNTWYGGEMKKGLFSVMNYYLPLKGIASMHCSANTDLNGKHTTIFFGLSGTGKTTLSTDPHRLLIGDDEHGWDDNGIFNLEGGCYAKVINLDKNSEPDIYGAIKKEALLENVSVNEQGEIDFSNSTVTENTRVSYPINHIKHIVKPISSGPHAENVIFLSCDAYGVLPPVSILTHEQTRYYFLSGYTSKIAGTERGINEPVPTFSSCFGQPFLELHPNKYADELIKRMEANNSRAFLVNTGWNGTGKRISIGDTRKIINAIMNGEINQVPKTKLPIFNLVIPTKLPGVNSDILDPRKTYTQFEEWEIKSKNLKSTFDKNYKKFILKPEGKISQNKREHELVSIVTPFYNSKKLFNKTYESVIAQTYQNWEWIIVDDYSTDGSQGFLKKNCSKDKRIKLIFCDKNGGSAAARNTGLDAVNGRYVTFLDADDTIDSQYLEKQVNFIKKNGPIVTCGYRRIKGDSVTTFIPRDRINFNDALKGNDMSCLTTMYDRLIIGEQRFKTTFKTDEDYVFWLEILGKGYVCKCNRVILASYFLHSKSKNSKKIMLLKSRYSVFHNILGYNVFKSLWYITNYYFYGKKKYRGIK